MTRKKKNAPRRSPRGVKKSRTYITSNRSTARSRLPSTWRTQLPDPGRFYPAFLSEWVEQGGGVGEAQCPFHTDAAKSLQVDLLGFKGCWRCADCGRRGDLISMVQELRQIPFPKAVRWLTAWRPQQPKAEDAQMHIRACRELLTEGSAASPASKPGDIESEEEQ